MTEVSVRSSANTIIMVSMKLGLLSDNSGR